VTQNASGKRQTKPVAGVSAGFTAGAICVYDGELQAAYSGVSAASTICRPPRVMPKQNLSHQQPYQRHWAQRGVLGTGRNCPDTIAQPAKWD
jgi:hypothetical protein